MSTWEERIRGVLGGISFDPKANALPNEGAIPYMGRRVKEAAVDAYKPIREGLVNPLNKFLFGTTPEPEPVSMPGNKDRFAAQKETGLLNPATSVARPEGTATYKPGTTVALPERGNFRELIGQSPQSKDKERTAAIAGRISPENPYGADVVNGGMRTNPIRVGALTDAEAARNLQDRALQDQATQAEVARLDRATEAMKSLREARSPRFSFGTDVIGSTGGIDSKLDEASGRVINRNTPANVVADRMIGAVRTAKNFGAGEKAGLLAATQMGQAYQDDKQLQSTESQMAAKQPVVNPLDTGRFLLDQQKFAQQQGIDKTRLNIDASTLKDKQAGTALEQQKYADTQRKDFMENFAAPEGAPRDDLIAGILATSKATGLPPDIMNTYLQRVAKANNIDWENSPPKDLKLLFEKAVALAASENR